MAVAFASSAANAPSSGAGTTATFSYDSASGSDRMLFVQMKIIAGSASGVTYAGEDMTRTTDFGTLAMFYLAAPATGANNIVIFCTTSDTFAAECTTFTGVDQTTPLGTQQTGSGSGGAMATASITVPTDGMAWGSTETGYTSAGQTFTGTGSTTLTSTARHAGPGHRIAGGYRSTTGTLTWNLSGSARAYTARGWPINPSGAAAGIAPPPKVVSQAIQGSVI